MECARLRVKDCDFAYQHITIHDGKGAQDRVTVLPQPLIGPRTLTNCLNHRSYRVDKRGLYVI